MTDLQAQLAQWKTFFAHQAIECDVDSLTIPLTPPFEGQLVILSKSLGLNELCELFKDGLWKFGVYGAIAPIITREPGSDESVTLHLSDKIGKSDRSAEDGDYAFWAKRHVGDSMYGLYAIEQGIFDTRLTLAEAFLYHLILMQEFGEEYVDIHRDHFQPCKGTHGNGKRYNVSAYPCLRWDLQDNKVCLDWRSDRW